MRSDIWQRFLAARLAAIHSSSIEGLTIAEIIDVLNLDPGQAELLAETARERWGDAEPPSGKENE